MLDKDRIECGMYQSIENSCLRTQGVMIPCGVRDREQDKQTVKEALKLRDIVIKWLKDSDIPAYGDWTFSNLTKFLEESKK